MYCNIFVTSKCNLKCSYCYVNKESAKDMDSSLSDSIICFIKRMLVENNDNELMINFFGGEPILKIDWIQDFIKKVNSLEVDRKKFIMTTNGTLLTPDVVDILKEHNFSLSLSLDGSPEIHNKYRVYHDNKGSWEVIEKNIPYLLEVFPHVMARVTFNATTCEALADSISFIAKKGFQLIKVVPDYFDENWTDERFHILKVQISEITERKERGEYEGVVISLFDYEPKLRSDCDGGTSSFVIDIKGDIYPCSYVADDPKFKIGTVTDWRNYKKHSYSVNDEERKQCSGCRYFNCCTSKRCLFVNYKMTKNVSTPNGFFCEYEKILYSLAGK